MSSGAASNGAYTRATSAQDGDLTPAEHAQFLLRLTAEFRTIVSGIIGMNDLCLDTVLDDEQRDYLSTAQDCARGLLAAVNEVAELSRIAGGKVRLDDTEFDVRAVVAAALDAAAADAHAKGVEIVLDIAPAVPATIVCDEGRLRDTIDRLTRHAVHATAHGEVVLTVNAAAPASTLVALEFALRDTSGPISPEKLSRLFSPSAAVTPTDGIDLSLVLGQQIVRTMGGRIEATSADDEGIELRFRLVVGTTSRTTTRSSFPGARALVVEPNPRSAQALRALLEERGLATTLVATMDGAVAAARAAAGQHAPIDVVFVNAAPESGDLDDAVRALSTALGVEWLPVIALGAPIHGNAAPTPVPNGVAGWLVKPVREGPLDEALAAQISPRRGAGAVAPGAGGAPDVAAGGPALHILVVEDNLVNQKLAVKLLQKRGWTATVAGNGWEALDAIGCGGIDLVLMDLQMPELGGIACVQILRERELETGTHLPVIALTANCTPGERARCLAVGMDDFVPKPIRSEQLYSAITRLAAERTPPQPTA